MTWSSTLGGLSEPGRVPRAMFRVPGVDFRCPGCVPGTILDRFLYISLLHLQSLLCATCDPLLSTPGILGRLARCTGHRFRMGFRKHVNPCDHGHAPVDVGSAHKFMTSPLAESPNLRWMRWWTDGFHGLIANVGSQINRFLHPFWHQNGILPRSVYLGNNSSWV